MKKYIFIIYFIFVSGNVFSQPVDIPILLSANYGELRSNHFHSGIDIKTQGVIGKNVMSIADGYISRVGVSPYGFGHVLYIAHPDGTTSVYAHLDSFSPAIETYVKQQQYAAKSFRVDLYPAKDRFPVKKGEKIALSGNSGSSGGPHLHFEIRDGAQVPLDPLRRNVVTVKDTIAPFPVTLYWVDVDYYGSVPVHTTRHKIAAIKKGDLYMIQPGTLTVGKEGYMALEIRERKNGSDNYFVPSGISAYKDGEQFFGMNIDELSFASARYSNAVDYTPAAPTPNGVFRLCVLSGNPLRIYNNTVNKGMVSLSDTLDHKMEVRIEDEFGNTSRLRFNIRRDNNAPAKPTPPGEPVLWAYNYNYSKDGFSVYIPSGSLYESTILNISKGPRYINAFSPVYSILNENELLQKSITITIDASALPAELRDKALVGTINSAGKSSAAGGGWKASSAGEAGVVETTVSSFGKYYIAVDTVAPKIVPALREGEVFSSAKSMTITISDDFSGINTYTATIDGQWALFEYDPKTNRLIHYFDDQKWPVGSARELVLTVVDGKGNKVIRKISYRR